MKTLVFSLLALPFLTAAIALADESPAQVKVDQREARQEQRIENGVKNGSLTQKEANRLEKEQTAIKNQEKKDLADGTLSKKEQRKLNRMQNRASRDISRKKHNERKAQQ